MQRGRRNGDSVWALANAELDAGLQKLRDLHESGEADAFVRDHDRLRQAFAQSVTLPAWRI